jgi:hypothetical protein
VGLAKALKLCRLHGANPGPWDRRCRAISSACAGVQAAQGVAGVVAADTHDRTRVIPNRANFDPWLNDGGTALLKPAAKVDRAPAPGARHRTVI